MFGATQPSPQATSIFGSTPSTFGAAQPSQAPSIFGSTVAPAAQMGTTVKFEPAGGQGKYTDLTKKSR